MPDINSLLSTEDIDVIGEIANISIGTGAVVLNKLIGVPIKINIPIVTIDDKDSLMDKCTDAGVFVEITYKEGLEGSNTILLKETDVKLIAGSMMHGIENCENELKEELNDMHLSAISEAMNQMMGSAVTALSKMLDRKVNITPPESSIFSIEDLIDFGGPLEYLGNCFVSVSLNMEIGDVTNSTIMQFYPLNMVHTICDAFKTAKGYEKKL